MGLLFIVILIISFVVVKIGAIAFELTGLQRSLAQFQAISCFTGTGFTTKESELITGNPQRRRIASVLMVLGRAGIVTLIATFVNSLRPDALITEITIPFLHLGLPSYLLPWINFIIIIVFVYVLYRIFAYTRLERKLTDILKARIVKREIIYPVSFEELLVATGGYGVSSIEICKDSPILNKTIVDAKLRSHDITVLVIERNGQTIPNPSANTKVLLEDRLICFGKLSNIRSKLCVIPK